MPEPDALAQALINAALEPTGDLMETQANVRAVLDKAGARIPDRGEELHSAPVGATVVRLAPGQRAVIIPEIHSSEITAMAGCEQLLNDLLHAEDWQAVRRAINWLSARMSTDEIADYTTPTTEDEGCC